MGHFIFDWSDEYWKAGSNYYNVQVGGPDGTFKGGAFAGSYYDEAGFGVTSDVDQSLYGLGKPNISRACPKHSTAVGGIPEVVQDKVTEPLMPFGDSKKLACAVENLIQDVARGRYQAALLKLAHRLHQNTFKCCMSILPRDSMSLSTTA